MWFWLKGEKIEIVNKYKYLRVTLMSTSTLGYSEIGYFVNRNFQLSNNTPNYVLLRDIF